MNKIKGSSFLNKKIPSLLGKSFLISGCSSGIGLGALRALLYKGAFVYMAVRNKEKALGVIEKLKKELGEDELKVEVLLYDQSDFSSIASLVDGLKGKPLDGVILNSAIYYPKKGAVGQDGTALTYYVNAIGTTLMLEHLTKSFPSIRYVVCGSIMNRSPRHDTHLSYLKKNFGRRWEEYSVSKRACMNASAYYLKQGYDVVVATPGVSATAIFTNFAPIIRRMGSALLNVVVHKPWKACLGEVLGLTNPKLKGKYLIPSFLGISGYPKIRKLPKKAYKHADDLIFSLRKEGYLN